MTQAITRRRGPGRRGITVFVVLLVISMLLAVGTFAMRISNLGVSNAGRYRQMTQTHYVSEAGVLHAMAELQRDPTIYWAQLATTNPPAPLPGAYKCKSIPDDWYGTPGIPAGSPNCVRLGYAAFEEVAVNATGPTNPLGELFERKALAANGLSSPGSFGTGNLHGNFAVEITDMTEATEYRGAPSGGGTSTHMKYYRATILSVGQILPTDDAGTIEAITTTGFKYNVSYEATRAQVLLGPVPN